MLPVPDFRYAQFCPIARVAEILGERWTLLILRELILGPARFSDLRARLVDVSPSVLAGRLASLEQHGIVVREEMPPPAASTVYLLTEAGRAVEPMLNEMARWGARFLDRSRDDDHFEPSWVRAAVRAFARRDASPELAVALRVVDGDREHVVYAAGGADGTTISEEPIDVAGSVRADGRSMLGMMSGLVPVGDARKAGLASVEGDASRVERLCELFEMQTPPDGGNKES